MTRPANTGQHFPLRRAAQDDDAPFQVLRTLQQEFDHAAASAVIRAVAVRRQVLERLDEPPTSDVVERIARTIPADCAAHPGGSPCPRS